MTYSIETILQGIASVLSSLKYPIYVSNRQQGVKTPCFFISLIPGSDKDEIDDREFVDLGLDIVFLQDTNIINAMDGIYKVLEFLQENLRMIPYTQGEEGEEETTYLHTYDRAHHLEEMDLHYQFHLRNRMHLAKNETLMQALEELNYEIKVKQSN